MKYFNSHKKLTETLSYEYTERKLIQWRSNRGAGMFAFDLDKSFSAY